jgi:Ser/Thr protein kinase RdoA (MazF antagonist)
MFGSILSEYGFDESEFSVKPYGNGLINHTWKIIYAGREFLLQKINQQVFKRPLEILDNCRQLESYFKTNNPEYLFVAPLPALNHQNYVVDGEKNIYRLFPFVKNSHSFNSVSSPAVAFEAAKQFGKFTRLLSSFDPLALHTTLPDFHNLSLRFLQYQQALENAGSQRIAKSALVVSFLDELQEIVARFENARNNNSFTNRVIHHDAKINNVLFDIGTNKALCVIDLDTVMTGYYISDVGDMLRTYLSPANEEETDTSLIRIREEYFYEIVNGYLGEMQSELSPEEIQYFVYAGKFAIYLQAIRFITDYLDNDRYYQIKHPEHNLVRANNQAVLLKRYMEKEKRMDDMLEQYIK